MPKDESKVAGGVARAKKLTPEQRSEIAKRAAESRWSPEIQDATHAGTLTLGDAEIQCYVLADGQRIISTRGVMKALGRTWRGRKYSGTDLPVFVEAKNLLPIITQADREVLVPVQFRTPTGGKGEGFKAEVLPTVCEIYLRAHRAKHHRRGRRQFRLTGEILRIRYSAMESNPPLATGHGSLETRYQPAVL